MRTTLTIDQDVAMELRNYAHEHNLSFKEVVNSLLRMGLSSAAGPRIEKRMIPPTVSLGGFRSEVELTDQEDPDGEIARFLRVTKEEVTRVESQRQ